MLLLTATTPTATYYLHVGVLRVCLCYFWLPGHAQTHCVSDKHNEMQDLPICVVGSAAIKGFGRVQTDALTARAELGFVPMGVDCIGWVLAGFVHASAISMRVSVVAFSNGWLLGTFKLMLQRTHEWIGVVCGSHVSVCIHSKHSFSVNDLVH